MAEQEPQHIGNHTRYVPLHHFVASSLLLINLVWSCYRIYHALRDAAGRFVLVNSLVELLVAFALILMWSYLRVFPLAVQDRVIRLEMRLRLAELLPQDLRPRISELRPRQLIAMRFASDQELPELTRKVLDEKIVEGAAIKQLIRTWQADHLRA
jgi:Family of unknown function (DUF6526)